MRSARSDRRRTSGSWPASPGRSLVVTKMSARPRSLAASAAPISASLPYMVAVSMCRYPVASAAATAGPTCAPVTFQVPKPTMGMLTSPGSSTAGTACDSLIPPLCCIPPEARGRPGETGRARRPGCRRWP